MDKKNIVSGGAFFHLIDFIRKNLTLEKNEPRIYARRWARGKDLSNLLEERKKFSLSQLAQKYNVSHAAISKWCKRLEQERKD